MGQRSLPQARLKSAEQPWRLPSQRACFSSHSIRRRLILTLPPETADIRPMGFRPEIANAPLHWPNTLGDASIVHVRGSATGRHGPNFERARRRRKCRSTVPAPITSPAPATRRPLSAARRGRRSAVRKRRRRFPPALNQETQGLSAPSPPRPPEYISQCPWGSCLQQLCCPPPRSRAASPSRAG